MTSLVAQIGETLPANTGGWRVRRPSPLAGERDGGGRASARETAGRVAAGAIAEQLLARHGVSIVAWVDEVSGIAATVDGDTVTREQVDTNDIRCPDAAVAEQMIERVERARKDGDSVGGVIRVVPRGVPPG